MDDVYLSAELLSTLAIEDFAAGKDYGRDRGKTPNLSEAQVKEVDKLNQRLNAKASSKSKKGEEADEEIVGAFDLKSAPRAILHAAPLLKRSTNSIMQHNARRYGYLLNDVLLLMSPPSSSSVKISLHQVLRLDQVSVIDLKQIDPNEDPAAFEIRTPERPYQLIAESEAEKAIWLEELESTIFSYMASKEGKKPGWNLEVLRGSLYSAAYLGDADLLQRHCDRMLGESLDVPDESGMTALHWASLMGQLNCVRLLLDYGADIDVLNGGLNSALLMAAALGRHHVVLFLLNCGADIDVRNLKDYDCLLMAIIFNNYTSGLFEMVQVLKLRGLDINKQDVSGAAPLHQCTTRNLPNSIQTLVDAGADVNAKHGRSGLTPLQLACAGQCPEAETVRILLDKGAIANWKDMSNQTAFDMLLSAHKAKSGSRFADTSSATGLMATVDEVSDFVTTVLPVLLELTRKGGRFEPDAIVHLRNSFQDMVNSGRGQWLQLAEPENFGEFIRTRDDSADIFSNGVKWTSDNASQCCLMCLGKFTMSNRRHHCRSCGILCCDLCSSKRLKLPIVGGAAKVNKGKAEGDRCCDSCFNRLNFAFTEWTQALNTAKKVERKLEQAKQEELKRNEGLKSSASTGSMSSTGGRSPTNSRGVAAANAAASETLKALEERGQKMGEVAEKSEQMKSAASDFHQMTRALHQQMQAKNSGW